MYKKFTRFFCTPPGYINKFLLIMKLTTFILLVTLMQVSAAGFAQKITLNAHNVPLEQVFKDIRKQSGYDFIYTGKLISKANPVTIQLKDASIEDVLKECFADQQLDYTIDQKTVIVKEKQLAQPTAPAPPKDVTGQVLDKQGVPLVSATVLDKRTQLAALTDAKGNFTLHNVLPEDIIKISYIGYKPFEIQVQDKTVIKVVMEETTNALDAVVVQAYGQTSQRLNTGDISTVTAKEIEQQPVMNALTALEGKVPGLVVTQTSGYASAPFKIEIEGRSSIDGKRPSEPLYIIDGVPLTILESGKYGTYNTGSAGITQNGLTGPANGQSPLFSINPQDIASITVLKDADATAIYGSRGANGVIIINTKKGEAGKTKFEADFYQGISKVGSRYDLLNTQQYIAMRQEAFKNDNITPTLSNAYDILAWGNNRYTNWNNYFWGGTGQSTDLQTGFSGGDKQTTFRIGASYHRETNIMVVSGSDQRASLQFNLTHHSLNQRLTISFTNLISYTQSNLRYEPGNIALPPNAPPLFNSEGLPNWDGWQYNDGLLQSVIGSLEQSYISKTNFINSQANIKYELFKGLNFSTEVGYSTGHNGQTFAEPIIAQNPATNPTGISQFGNNNNSNLIIEPNFEYTGLISKGKLNILLGASAQTVTQDGNDLTGTGYVNDKLLGSITNAPTVLGQDNSDQYKYEAAFARINYNWEDKYILNISARRDGSSRFGPGKQFGNFGAVGAAWIFTEEKWLKDNLEFLSFGKVRASYGVTGSDNIGDYNYLSQWSATGTNPYNGGASYVPANLANPDLQWQTNHKLEYALDLGFWKDRLTMNIAWYRNLINNELLIETIPSITGFGSIAANFPATVKNTGLLLSVNAKLIDQKKFQWSVNFNIGTNNNILAAFPGIAQSPYAAAYTVGQSLYEKKLLHFTGVDPQTGQYTFADKNHNGLVDNSYNTGASNDLYDVNTGVRSEGGFGTSIRYEGVHLDVFFHFRVQPYLLSATQITPGLIGYNQSTQVLNHWQKPGDIAEYPAFTNRNTASEQFFEYSDGQYSDGSYIRLQNLSLSYDLNEQWTKKIGIYGCQLFIRGQNLLLFTKYNGLDPDAPGFGLLPPAKILTAGIKFNL